MLVLQAVQALVPGQLFRFADCAKSPVRHGDVIRLCPDEAAPPFEVGKFSIRPRLALRSIVRFLLLLLI